MGHKGLDLTVACPNWSDELPKKSGWAGEINHIRKVINIIENLNINVKIGDTNV